MARKKDLGRDSGYNCQSCAAHDERANALKPQYIPESKWLSSPSLLRVVNALCIDGSPPRIVGGAVRDSLLGLPVSDIDLATPLIPCDVIDRLESARIKAIPTGIDHGTITAVADGHTFEITTLRRDVSTDGRRATVAFSNEWREDAARRDFTLNALYADPISREIFDYFGGIDDLHNNYLRFIGDPAQRIAEDHLRILRYFRFLARFGQGRVDDVALAACSSAANSLMALSRERIASELIKILSLPEPLMAVGLMIDHGIFNAFLPEISPNAKAQLARLIAREKQHGFITSPSARLCAIFPTDPLIADKVVMRLKLSNRMRNDIANRLGNAHPVPENFRTLAYHKGTDCAQDCAMLFAGDGTLPHILAGLSVWEIPVFPLKGGDIIARGLTAGPLVAKTLRTVEQAWIDENFPAKDRVMVLADHFVMAALSDVKNV
jgi:poly(A) polymerase